MPIDAVTSRESRTAGRRFGRSRPPWWPANERWPPAGPPWRHGGSAFLRRVALVAATLIGLVISLATIAIWLALLAVRWLGLTALAVPLSLAVLLAAAVASLAF